MHARCQHCTKDAPAKAVAEVDALRKLAANNAKQQCAAGMLRVTRRQRRGTVACQQRFHSGCGARLAKHGLRSRNETRQLE